MQNELDARSANAALADLYRSAFTGDAAGFLANPRSSAPWLLKLHEDYAHSAIRLMVVGQEANGWASNKCLGADPVAFLMEEYRKFQLGRDDMRPPLRQAAHRLYRCLNAGGGDEGFLWTNLVKLDKDGQRPPSQVEDAISSLGLLPREVEITRPHAVVFFTGPRYDSRLKECFPGVELERLSTEIVQLRHPSLPQASFRTFHPGYLWRRKKTGAIQELGDLIRSIQSTAAHATFHPRT